MAKSLQWDDDDNWDEEPTTSRQSTTNNNRNHFYADPAANNFAPNKPNGSNKTEQRGNKSNWNGDNGNIFKESINVPKESIGRIIGRKGSNIQNMQREFNVRIKIYENTAEVSGKNKSDVYDAIAKIKEQSIPLPKNRVDLDEAKHGSTSSSHDLPETNEPNAGCNDNENDAKSKYFLPNGSINWEVVREESRKAREEMLASLQPLVKNLYKESAEVANMKPEQVERIRFENNETTVERVFTVESNEDLPQAIPNPIWKFEHCFVEYPEIMEAIKKQGFEKPSPIQAQAWPVLLQGHNMIGIAQTGTGKTLAFLLPALIHIEFQPVPRSQRIGPNVLIVAPTRELALQIEREVSKYSFRGIKAVCIYGGGSRDEQIDHIEKGVEIIICTPGRLNDLCDAKIIDVKSVTYLVLDEADRMLDMGFEPQIRRFMIDIRPDRQTIMTSATWPPDVRYLASNYVQNAVQVCVGTLDLAATHTVKQVVEFVEDDDKTKKILDFVRNLGPNDKIIIFCSKKSRVDFLACDLALKNIDIQCLHGSRDQWDREQAIDDISSGVVKILIATDLASRGLDIDDITHVINYDFPRNIEEYVHRVGRTGRAGRTGISISYITPDDMSMASELIKILEEANQEVPCELRKMAERYNNIKAKRSANKRRGGGGRRGRGRDRDGSDGGGRNYPYLSMH